MNSIFVKFKNEDNSPVSAANRALREKILKEIRGLPGGRTLLNDALANGSIYIIITSDPIAGGEAHWDTDKRAIMIHSGQKRSAILADKKAQDQMMSTILFELCNAANPLLNNGKSYAPMQYQSAEQYARAMEKLEFKSHQRRAQIVNAAIDQKLPGWSDADRMKVYADNQFDEYFREVADKVMPEYGAQRTHANYYRQGWQRSAGVLRARALTATPTATPARHAIPRTAAGGASARTHVTPSFDAAKGRTAKERAIARMDKAVAERDASFDAIMKKWQA